MRLTMFAALLGTTALIPVIGMAQSNNAAQQPNQSSQTAQRNQQQGQAAASQLRSQQIYTPSGQQIGRVTAVVQGQDNLPQAVVAAGDRQVLIPATRIAYQNNRFTASGYTDEQIRQLPAYDQRVAAQYREVDPNLRIAIVGYDVDPVVAARPTAEASRILVQQAAPTVRVDQASPQVTVQQPQPNVTVFQPQPEIIVRQPQPTVTVNIPQPEIVVRMAQPDVNVAMAQPQVRVNQPQPQVAVIRPGEPQVQVERDQAQVQVIPPQGQANVQVQRNAGQPQVRYEAAEPRVVVNRAQGEPNVRVERMGEGQNQQANAQGVGSTTTAAVAETEVRREPGVTGAVTGTARDFRIRDLENMEVYNYQDEKLGEVKRLVRGISNDRQFVVLEHGGFLGLGEKEVPLPLDRFAAHGNRLYFRGLTEAELRQMPDWDMNDREYREFGDNETLRLGMRE